VLGIVSNTQSLSAPYDTGPTITYTECHFEKRINSSPFSVVISVREKNTTTATPRNPINKEHAVLLRSNYLAAENLLVTENVLFITVTERQVTVSHNFYFEFMSTDPPPPNPQVSWPWSVKRRGKQPTGGSPQTWSLGGKLGISDSKNYSTYVR
jgi:hypothetical protein